MLVKASGSASSLKRKGSGPLDERHFDAILSALGLQVWIPDKATEILIVSREGWSKRKIHELLDARSGHFLCYLISCQDPPADEEKTVRLLAGNHPVLQFLETVWFRWPSTEVPLKGDGQIDAKVLRVGYLKYRGYTVGKAGLTPQARRQVLVAVYRDVVPTGFPGWYIAQWGLPQSAARLKKIAESIASFCRNNKKKNNPATRAISDWEADLAWLKSQLYDGRYRFRWPSTEVW